MKKHVVPMFFVTSGYATTWRKAIIALVDMTAQVAVQHGLAEQDAQLRLIFDTPTTG